MGQPSAPVRQTSRPLQSGLMVFIFTLALYFYLRSTHATPQILADLKSKWADRSFYKQYGKDQPTTSIDQVTNDTLGFSKIFVIGKPEDGDKGRTVLLTSALTGFRVEYVDGVKGERIPDEAVPVGIDRDALTEDNLGTWRTHMNAIRGIVHGELESALIIEDGMDWDVRLKSQLGRIAQGTRALIPSGLSPLSPYGDSWDLLWLGHCGEVFPETLPENEGRAEHPKYVIAKDETVPPFSQITGPVDWKKYEEFTRWVHISGAPKCPFAYALSQIGARKVLYELSVQHLDGTLDNALSNLCRKGASEHPEGLRAKCLSVTPPLFSPYKTGDHVRGNYGAQKIEETSFHEVKPTGNIVWSARDGIKNTAVGLKMENHFGI
ncbi:glycosyltransferase family 25 protein [Seiridium cupressi]